MQNERDLEITNLDNFNNDLGKMSSETQNKGRYSAGSERLNTSRKKQFAIAGGIGALVVLGSLFSKTFDRSKMHSNVYYEVDMFELYFFSDYWSFTFYSKDARKSPRHFRAICYRSTCH